MRNYAKKFFIDVDAASFLYSAGITDATQVNALYIFVSDVKKAGIWAKTKAIYPFIGGTSDSHKWNLKDPRDLDAAFRIAFVGDWTHSANGINIANRTTTSYARTFFVPSSNFTNVSANMSIYARTFANDFSVLIGGGDASSYLQQGTGVVYYALGNPVELIYTGNNTGLLAVNRVSSTKLQMQRNGSIVLNSADTYSAYASRELYLGNYINTTTYQSRSSIAFASFGEGLNESESAQLYAAVQKFQTTLGRQV